MVYVQSLKKKIFLRKEQLLPTYVHTLNTLCPGLNVSGGGVGGDMGDMGDGRNQS